ncbi:DUF4124 domain-containing protein [Geobacter pickeringii]|uniref:DUF4124 domain-containing protein n=1 Tax=Geobacter pickeringii TaxID=345632 RepID=A0A0B5BEB3_9BACT|nr:DUF4124 domain-containing protein [Geobacter pickeringii]AJE03494.1 hypothetical protein GPICK_09155 [Geobacter pickeringii]
MLLECKKVLVVSVATMMAASTCFGATYRWVDDKGVVNFTDDPDRIPAKYRKKVREVTDSVPDSSSPTPTDSTRQERNRKSTPGTDGVAASPQTPKPVLYGGKDEKSWRAQFSALRAEIKQIREGLPKKEEQLVQLHRKRVIYQGAQERVAYNAKKEEIDKDQARIKELEAQLAALDLEASKEGVPLEWR